MRKEIYTYYKSFISDLTNKEKRIKTDIESFRAALGNNVNTINIQNKIKKALLNFKELADELHLSYTTENAPPNIPDYVLDRRQNEINDFLASYNSMNEEFTKLVNDKYSFKGKIEEDYKDKEDYKNKDTKELIKMTKDKMKEQDAMLNEIFNMIKVDKNDANNLNDRIKKDNDKKNDANKKTDKADSKLKKWTEKFKNLFKKK